MGAHQQEPCEKSPRTEPQQRCACWCVLVVLALLLRGWGGGGGPLPSQRRNGGGLFATYPRSGALVGGAPGPGSEYERRSGEWFPGTVWNVKQPRQFER